MSFGLFPRPLYLISASKCLIHEPQLNQLTQGIANWDICKPCKPIRSHVHDNFNLHQYQSTVNSEIFAKIIHFAKRVKRHTCDVKKSRLVPALPMSVDDRVISPFGEVYSFTKLFPETKPSRNLSNIQYKQMSLHSRQ